MKLLCYSLFECIRKYILTMEPFLLYLKKKKKKTFFAFHFNSPGVPNAFLNAQMLHVVFHIITIICSLFD